MKQKLVYMVLLLGMVMGLASCDNYLNIEPKGKRIPKSLADYEAFLRYEYGTPVSYTHLTLPTNREV